MMHQYNGSNLLAKNTTKCFFTQYFSTQAVIANTMVLKIKDVHTLVAYPGQTFTLNTCIISWAHH